MKIKMFTFNPFAENTYLLIGKENTCFLIDPGMSNEVEMAELSAYLNSENLTPSRLLLTHAHIDHVLGNSYAHKAWGLKPECHADSLPVLESCEMVAQMYGVPYLAGPDPESFLKEKESIMLDGEAIELRYVPGHAPGHLVLVDHAQGQVIAGDTLFNGSIGRTDLPGGDHDLLLEKIKSELYSLPDEFTVYPGHGPETTIGHEKNSNPFVKG